MDSGQKQDNQETKSTIKGEELTEALHRKIANKELTFANKTPNKEFEIKHAVEHKITHAKNRTKT